MSYLTVSALIVYVSWRVINIYHSYQYNKKMTAGNIWGILFTLLMCFWLVLPSVLFLFAKLFDGIFALGIGVYANLQTGPDQFLVQRDKVVNNYWSYAITDSALCVACFFMSIMGNVYG